MRYRNLLLAATILSVATGTSVYAADMAVKAPYAPVAVYNWTGFYVGGHIGGAWSNTTVADPTGVNFAPAGSDIGVNGSGLLGGAQVGYNWQAGNWVLGIQGDMSWTGINASAADPFVAGLNVGDKVDWLGMLTGRVGYAWNNTLLYGKGGVAWVHNKYSGVGGGFDASGSETRTGWTVGLGLEYAFARNWTTFIEYDYVGLGTRTVTLTDPTIGPFQASIKQNINLVKLGVNYKF